MKGEHVEHNLFREQQSTKFSLVIEKDHIFFQENKMDMGPKDMAAPAFSYSKQGVYFNRFEINCALFMLFEWYM